MIEMMMTGEQGTTPLGGGTSPIDSEAAVEQYYDGLHRFAFGLAGKASDAADLTQETYRRLLVKGDQIREVDRLKSWMYTTLYRCFLHSRRRVIRFPEVGLEAATDELQVVDATQIETADHGKILEALHGLDEVFRIPLLMFYLEDSSYRKIAGVLDIPIGTVMSRLSRGKTQLRHRLAAILDRQGDPPTQGASRENPATECQSLSSRSDREHRGHRRSVLRFPGEADRQTVQNPPYGG